MHALFKISCLRKIILFIFDVATSYQRFYLLGLPNLQIKQAIKLSN